MSYEVDPRLAHDTETTIAEARQLWWLVDRPNSSSRFRHQGGPPGHQPVPEGISVNVTLIFSLQRYREVMDAFLDGVERLRATGADLSTLGSVASFFVSRNDTETDKRLDKIGTDEAKALRGGRHRQRPAGLSGVREGFRLAALEGSGRCRRQASAAAVGCR